MAAISLSGMGGSSSKGAAPAPSSGTIIGGSLAFGGGGGSMFSGGAEGLAASYNAAYNSALQANQQNYNNILAGYQQLAGQQMNNQNTIREGYNTLTGQVLGDIEGSANAQRQLIDRAYAQQAAQMSQGMTNAGLNNTTVVASLQRGITFDQQLAQTDLANKFAQLEAQYRSTLGLAGLDYLNQANVQQMQLGTSQLNWMNSVEIPYPDANAYANLMSYYGQMEQADKDRALMEKLYGDMKGASSLSGVGGGTSGVRGGIITPSYGSSSTYSPGLVGAGGSALVPSALNSSYGTASSWGGVASDAMAGGLGGAMGGYDMGGLGGIASYYANDMAYGG